MTAITFPLKPITATKFSTSVKHSHKQTLVSTDTPSHWCLSSSSGEAGVCPRAPLPSYFILCDLTKSNKRAILRYVLTQPRKKENLSWEVAKAVLLYSQVLDLSPPHSLLVTEGDQQAASLSADIRQRFPLLPSKRAGDKAVVLPDFDYVRTVAGTELTGSPCPQLQSTILSVLHIKMDVTFKPGTSNHKPAAQLQLKSNHS